MNKERVREMVARGRMTKAGLDAIAHAFDKENDNPEQFKISRDILIQLKRDKDAWDNFKKLPGRYLRTRIGYIESRRKHGKAAFESSLNHFIAMTAKNKRFGMMR
jgi:uncharacterized protein YdeI (YjbR/CyaY-like superfamily)